MYCLGDKIGKRLKKIPKKGWEIQKNGVWFFEVLSILKLVEKCVETNFVVYMGVSVQYHIL